MTVGAAPPARQPDRRERPHRPPPPLHRGGALRRLGRRDRRRRARRRSRSSTRRPRRCSAPRARRSSARRSLTRAAGDRAAVRGGCSARASGSPQQQIQLVRNGRERTFNVRVTSEQARGEEKGFVVTLDDITDLVSAQRTSAWADVARRIAHEIKNPLTPIQLSAERIRRKYGKVITERPRGLRPVHRHDRPPGRRHQAHGRRVLVLRAHAEADDRQRGHRRDRPRRCSFLMRVAHPDIAFVDELPADARRRPISTAG